MKLFKILTIGCLAFLFACSEKNSKHVLTEQNLAEAIANHFSAENHKEKRFKNFEIKALTTEQSKNKPKPVYKAAYQVSANLAEDLYQLKPKRSCNNKYVTYKLLHHKDSKHAINGTMVAEYKTGYWDYSFKNENDVKGNRLPDLANLFRPESIEEIDFIKQTCLKMGERKKEAIFAELKAKVILIDDASYDRFEQEAESIDGKKTYASICASCHDTGESGSPRIDNKNAWHPELGTVKKALLQNILIAEDSKHPRAGEFIISEAEILASINYMLNKVKKTSNTLSH